MTRTEIREMAEVDLLAIVETTNPNGAWADEYHMAREELFDRKDGISLYRPEA